LGEVKAVWLGELYLFGVTNHSLLCHSLFYIFFEVTFAFLWSVPRGRRLLHSWEEGWKAPVTAFFYPRLTTHDDPFVPMFYLPTILSKWAVMI
jgi:hypothetical protein